MTAAVQTALPASDDATGLWTPTPLSPRLDQGQPVMSGNTAGDSFQVKLQGLAWPNLQPNQDGQVVLTVKLAGDGLTQATVLLLQGEQLIAFQSYTSPAALTACTLALSAAQAALISNFADLHVRVYAGAVATLCCPDVNLPPVLHGTFVCACSEINGVSFPLFYQGLNFRGDPYWRSPVVPLAGTNIALTCDQATGTWTLSNGTTMCVTIGTTGPTSVSCASLSSLLLVFPATVGYIDPTLCPDCTLGEGVTVQITT